MAAGSTARNRRRRAITTLRARLDPDLGGAPLALLPFAMPGRRPRLSFGRVAAATALLARAVYAGTPDAAPEAPPQEVTATPLPPEPPPVP